LSRIASLSIFQATCRPGSLPPEIFETYCWQGFSASIAEFARISAQDSITPITEVEFIYEELDRSIYENCY
jgi:hypothetical protein